MGKILVASPDSQDSPHKTRLRPENSTRCLTGLTLHKRPFVEQDAEAMYQVFSPDQIALRKCLKQNVA